MKKYIISIFAVALLFYTCNVSAQELKVVALGFIVKAREARGVEKYLNDIIKEEVMGTGRYAYIPQKDLLDRWFGDGDYMGLEVNYVLSSVLNRNSDETSKLYAMQRLMHVDFIILSGVESDGKDLTVNSMIINVENGRYAAALDTCTLNDINEIVRKHVKRLLDKGPALQNIEADKEIDRVNSLVAYDFTSDDGKSFQIRVKYNGIRTEPGIDDIFIVPGLAEPYSTQTFRLKTREGKPIEFKGTYKRSRLTNVVSIAEPPDAKGTGTTQETLSILSRGGYILNITLYWKGKELKATKVVPLINPYGEVR